MTKLSTVQQLLKFILDLFFPPQCVGCKATTDYFCVDCEAKLTYITPPICNKCGYPNLDSASSCYQCQIHPLEYMDAIRSVAFFEKGPFRSAIHKFKYQNNQVLSKSFARLLAKFYTASDLNVDIILPVPLHKSRYKERGYNQSNLLAVELSKLLNKKTSNKILLRHTATKSQMTLNAQERKTNVKNAFTCCSDLLAGKAVLLIDDVCTTGATLDACAQALKKVNASMVYGLTLARAR